MTTAPDDMAYAPRRIFPERIDADNLDRLRGAYLAPYIVRAVQQEYSVWRGIKAQGIPRAEPVVTASYLLDSLIAQGDAEEDDFAPGKPWRQKLRKKISNALEAARNRGELEASEAMQGNRVVRAYEPTKSAPLPKGKRARAKAEKQRQKAEALAEAQSEALDELGGELCTVCGRLRPSQRSNRGPAPMYHRECSMFNARLKQVVDLLQTIRFAEGPVGDARLKAAQAAMFSARNMLNNAKRAPQYDSDEFVTRK